MNNPAPSVLISHPTGNENVRNALRALADQGMLAEFWTTVAWDPESWLNHVLPSGIREQLARRSFPDAPSEKLRRVPAREAARLALRSTPLHNLLCSSERPFSVIATHRQFDAAVARHIHRCSPQAVYAYEGGALHTFRASTRKGIATLYELTSGYWHWERKLLAEEAELAPEFASVIPKLSDSARHLGEKEEELALAGSVFVPSRHVRRTLAGIVLDDIIRVINYGAPAPALEPPRARATQGALRVLFVGGLHQRKGIGYLLQAVEMLGPDVELTLIGQRFAPNPTVDAACRRCRWFPSLPHPRVLEVMAESDVLVLPSLSEAFGLVATEAISRGLPVVVTPNVGAADLLFDGREGFIVPIRSADAIAARLSELHRDRELLARMSRNAQATAVRNSWEHYRSAWAHAVKAAIWP